MIAPNASALPVSSDVPSSGKPTLPMSLINFKYSAVAL